jgi:histidinol-phosphate aminotransferase
VFVDEAYIDYLPNPKEASLISNIKKGDNIIVARTFSKVYGLAGMRVGYIVAQPAMIDTLAKYNVELLPTPSIKAAMVAYQDEDFIKMVIEKTNASRDYLFSALKAAGYSYIPSVTNFAMFPIRMEGQQFVDEMMKRSVAVRYWKFNNKEWCRVSIGRMDEMEAFVSALKEIG